MNELRIKYKDFVEELQRVERHPNRRHFIYKNIIVNNLYGVDIMAEAVEICKLRLFLKLVAETDDPDRVEPLPDIDFNIRAGNTLVGYATLAEVQQSLFGRAVLDRIRQVDIQLRAYRNCQTEIGISATALRKNKEHIRTLLAEIEDKLDRSLFSEYGARDLAEWKRTHQPFHWYVEFNSIIQNGGFDVIVGNPPYINAAKVRKEYTVKTFKTESCPDIYAWVLERAYTLLADDGRSGMIVPLSLGFSSDFLPCRQLIFDGYSENWFSSFGRIPSALFNFDVRVRNTIHVGHKSKREKQNFTTRLHRWFEDARPTLFPTLEYARFEPKLWKYRIPKLNTQTLADAFEAALKRSTATLEGCLSPRVTPHVLHFKKTAYNWLNFCRELPPCFDENGKKVAHTKFGELYFPSEEFCLLAMTLANGKLMMIFWFAVADDFDVTRWNFGDFPADLSRLPEQQRKQLLAIAPRLEAAMLKAVQFKLNAGRRVGNYNLAKCRDVTDQSDAIFANHLGFDAVWDDIELYYAQTIKTNFEDDD